jgi:hypothetical protein
MRMHWKLALPAIGLVLFAHVTYLSVRRHNNATSRYFWWSSIPLDSEPVNQSHSACKSGTINCQVFGPESIYVTTSLPARVLMLSTAPAFLLGTLMLEEFAWHGINEIPVFFVIMPLLICGWFYSLGFLIDKLVGRWLHRGARLLL